MAISQLSRFYNAANFAYGAGFPDSPQALVVVSGPGVSGAQTLTVQQGKISLTDGTVVTPLNTNAPIIVGTAGNSETVTPTAVSNNIQSNTYGLTATVTATFANAHSAGDRIASGTFGLQEAINFASSGNGGTVVVDQGWVNLGGTQAMLEAVTMPANVSIKDNRVGGGEALRNTTVLTNTQILNLSSTAVQLLPAPGTGAFYNILKATVVNENAGTAFTGGGALTVGYGPASSLTQALSGTIAASFLTTPTSAQVIQLAGVNLSSSSESVYDNQPIYISAVTANFAAGTGATLRVSLVYSVEGK